MKATTKKNNDLDIEIGLGDDAEWSSEKLAMIKNFAKEAAAKRQVEIPLPKTLEYKVNMPT